MKRFNLSGAAVAAALLLSHLASSIAVQAAPAPHGAKTSKKTVYVCPMHADVVALKPGKCPKCKMTLIKKSVGALYTCKMHPEVLSLKAGKCPKCHMALTEKK